MNGPREKALYRFATKPAQDELGRRPAERASSRQHPDSFGVVRPSDLATDRDGRVYVLSRPNNRPARVEIFARDGSIVSSFTLERPIPSALALTPDGWLIAASADNTLTWYDAAGRLLRQTDRDARIGNPRDVTVRQNGEILVADSQGKRVVRLSPDGSITGSLTGRGTLSQPARVAVGGDGGIWVLDAVGRLLKLSDSDEVLGSLSVPPTPVDNAYHFVPLANDEVIVAEPETPRLSRRDLRGNLLDVISGFERPMALAIDADGRLLVADPDLDTVGILPRIADAPRPSAVRVRRLAD